MMVQENGLETFPPPTDYYGLGDDFPVYWISWYGAIAFCNKLSELEGLSSCYAGNEIDGWTFDYNANGYRLPTEAEWEYAARGGNNHSAFYFSGSDNFAAVAWHDGNSGENGTGTNTKSHTVGTAGVGGTVVGSGNANALGLFDMSGNVAEWCWDKYGDYSSDPQTDPVGSAVYSDVDQFRRVIRGGSFSINFNYCLVYRRFDPPSGFGLYTDGFRVVRSVSPFQ